MRFSLAKAPRTAGARERAEALAAAALADDRALVEERTGEQIAAIEAWRAEAPPKR